MLNSFTDLSMELFSNRFLFIRWGILIMGTARRNRPLSALSSGSYDQLFYASWSGDESCVKMLLGSGDTAAWDLDSALHVAPDFGHLDTVALLIRQGAVVTVNGATHGLLCSAVRADYVHIVPLVITDDAAVSTQPRLRSPLRAASHMAVWM